MSASHQPQRTDGDADDADDVEVWQEPVRGGYPHPAFASLSGIDRFRRFRDFSLPPPMHHLCGVYPGEGQSLDEGTGTMPATAWLLSPQGRISLGAMAPLADLAFGFAFGNTLGPGGGYTTAELSLTRLGTPALEGTMVARGKLVHATRTMALTEARVYDGQGVLVAAGTSRLAVFPPAADLPEIPDPPPRPELPEHDTPDPYLRPVRGAVLDPEVWAEHSGLEVLQAHARGDLPLPPIGRLTGLRVAEAAEGRAVVVLPATGWLTSPVGTVQGGFTAMLADAALQCAIQTTAEAGHAFTPLDVKVNYLRPVVPDGGLLQATGEITHRGRSLAIAHAAIVDSQGRKVAVATGSAAFEPPDAI